jgi:ribonuclease T1
MISLTGFRSSGKAAAFRRITAAALLMVAVTLPAVHAKTDAGEAAVAIGTIAVADLPGQARTTLKLIKQGGPFPFPRKDGSTFGNRERTLPRQPRGYYSEYTVKTPASRDRGARRIIAGKGSTGNPATSGEYYYTDDHYASFKRILE